MKYNFILALDPSGAYNEGKGTTGWCVYNCLDRLISVTGNLQATKQGTRINYWEKHLSLIDKYHQKYGDRFIVVIEDYALYANKALAQSNSKMETCRLLGIIEYFCWQQGINTAWQMAVEVKTRWSDTILTHKHVLAQKGRGYIVPNTGEGVDRHAKDAIRHAIHYATFKNDGGQK